MELIDTHVHLNHPRLAKRVDQELSNARRVGVTRMINIGFNLDASRESVALAEKYASVWATVGYHPHWAKEMGEDEYQLIRKLAKHERVVAIGEIGLDYHYEHSPRQRQRHVFRRQLELAFELNLPVVIHQREAALDTWAIVNEFGPLPKGGVMHCFSGAPEMAAKFIELNLHIGLGGPVTFANARKAKLVAQSVSLERLLLETDCPWLAPHPNRGKTNRPEWLPIIAREIASLRQISLEELAAATSANAKKVFGLV